MPYRFLDFELDLARSELRRSGRTLRLTGHVYDLVVHLVRNRERVVTQEELLEAVWPGHAVTNASLSHAVAEARKALGDTRDSKRIIQTVYGRGYRWVAATEERRVERQPGWEELPFVGRARGPRPARAGGGRRARGGKGRAAAPRRGRLRSPPARHELADRDGRDRRDAGAARHRALALGRARAAPALPAAHAGGSLRRAVSVGSVARPLGMLAGAQGRTDEAERLFEEALEIELAADGSPWVARSEVAFAQMLAARGGPGDAARARALAQRGRARAEALEMKLVVEEAAPLAD